MLSVTASRRPTKTTAASVVSVSLIGPVSVFARTGVVDEADAGSSRAVSAGPPLPQLTDTEAVAKRSSQRGERNHGSLCRCPHPDASMRQTIPVAPAADAATNDSVARPADRREAARRTQGCRPPQAGMPRAQRLPYTPVSPNAGRAARDQSSPENRDHAVCLVTPKARPISVHERPWERAIATSPSILDSIWRRWSEPA